MEKVTQMSRLVLEGKSDSNESTPSGWKKWLKGADGGRDQLPRHRQGQVGWGPWPGTSGPGGRWGQEGQHYCLLQRGQGREVPRGHTSPVFRTNMRLYIEQQDLGEQDLTIGESPREQGGRGHLGTYSPKTGNASRICLCYAIHQKKGRLSLNSLWIRKSTQTSASWLNAKTSAYFHLQFPMSSKRTTECSGPKILFLFNVVPFDNT